MESEFQEAADEAPQEDRNSAVSSKIRVGLIGLGFAGKSLHLPALLRNSFADIKILCDEKNDAIREALATVTAAGRELPATTTDCESVLLRDDVDAVFVLTPTATHVQLAIAALENGKHVFCEKPIALNIDDAKRLDVTERAYPDLTVMIGQVLRFWPEYVEANNLIKHDNIGQPRIARTFRAVSIPSPWYADESQSGGVIIDLALHDIDFLCWTIGPVESIFAQSIGAEYAQIQLNFSTGAIAHVEASWAVPANFPFTTSLEVTGATGLIATDNAGHAGSLEVTISNAMRSITTPSELNGYDYQDLAFFQSVLNKSQSPVPPSAVLHSLAVALAARRSLQTNEIVYVDEIEKGTLAPPPVGSI